MHFPETAHGVNLIHFLWAGLAWLHAFLHRLERIGIFIYGSGAVLYKKKGWVDCTIWHWWWENIHPISWWRCTFALTGSLSSSTGMTAISVMPNIIMIIIISFIFDLTFVTYFDISTPLFLKWSKACKYTSVTCIHALESKRHVSAQFHIHLKIQTLMCGTTVGDRDFQTGH